MWIGDVGDDGLNQAFAADNWGYVCYNPDTALVG